MARRGGHLAYFNPTPPTQDEHADSLKITIGRRSYPGIDFVFTKRAQFMTPECLGSAANGSKVTNGAFPRYKTTARPCSAKGTVQSALLFQPKTYSKHTGWTWKFVSEIR